MKITEWESVFAENINVKVTTRSGKEYWIHRDQLEAIRGNGDVWGVPLKRHPRAKNIAVWLNPDHLKLAPLTPTT